MNQRITISDNDATKFHRLAMDTKSYQIREFSHLVSIAKSVPIKTFDFAQCIYIAWLVFGDDRAIEILENELDFFRAAVVGLAEADFRVEAKGGEA